MQVAPQNDAQRGRLSLLRPQFKLKSIFVVFVLFAVVLGMVVVPALKQRKAVRLLTQHGSYAYYADEVRWTRNGWQLEEHENRPWNWGLLRDVFYDVDILALYWKDIPEDSRQLLDALDDAQVVYIHDEYLTPAALKEIRTMFPDSHLETSPVRGLAEAESESPHGGNVGSELEQ